MLSYQHLYHAGNLADVHKHALMAWILSYMVRKDKPLTYMESHAGRGLYDLSAPEAQKTGEAHRGIGIAENWFPPSHPYRQCLTQTRDRHGPTAYPGSPVIAGNILRPKDVIHLCELHPQENAALTTSMAPFGAHIHATDGLAMLQSLCPPQPRRGVLLIDPSYEVKSEYTLIPSFLDTIARKWNVGIIALWYPILAPHSSMGQNERPRHIEMVAHLRLKHPDALVHEVHFPPAYSGNRLLGSGMVILNAPYGLEDAAAEISSYFTRLKCN